jgi:CheY-like chemotaxis protein
MARLLIVDDDPDARRLIGLVLRRADHEPLYAEDGFRALELMEREQPDLVILDLMLPGMDGFEVLEAMRQRPNLATMPVVVLTAKAQLGPAVGSKLMNVHAYLTKPVSAETLVHTVQEVLTEIQIPASRERRALEIACVESWPGCAGELLAAALAAALAEHAPTLLIDVEGNGRGAFVFDLEPRMSLEELEAGADPTRGLGAPRDGLQVWSIDRPLGPALVDRVAERLTSQARFVVWMPGDPLGPVAARVLPRCQRVLLTFESHGPGLRRARAVLRGLEGIGIGLPAVEPVWVRRWAVPEPWTEAQIRHRLNDVPIRTWPVDPVTAYRALQEGRPIHEIEPESPTARRIREWVEELVPLI